MKHLLFCIAAASSVAALSAVIEVSPDGAVNSPEMAVAKVRADRAAGMIGKDESVELRFAAGVYRMERTLTLEPVDSNLHFIGGNGVVFSGGAELPRFAAGEDGIWRVKVPEGMTFEQLWVNGRRAVRAKSPNKFN